VASLTDIQALANKIAGEFHPDKIILFGSHAPKTPTPDSDVDILVIMPANGKTPHAQAAEIYMKCPCDFPADVIVRTPEEFERRLQMRDWFMRDIAREGITLYAA
jgi:predicted nucleotidyltransferase